MDITKFNEKFNRLEGNVYTFEEIIRPINGVYEAELIHDNVETSTINIYTGSKLTGDKINTYTISTPSLTPWRTHIKIFSNISPLYISYEFTGDTVEAEDINNVQDAINDTQKELNKEVDRATNAEKVITDNLNKEIDRATNRENIIENNLNNEIVRSTGAEKTLQNNINNEADRAKSAESTLTTNLNNEVTRATNKEAELSENISSEVIRATNKESALQNSINNEATRAKSAEKTLTDNLNSEINRAKKAEDDEATRAKSAEKTLTDNLNKEINRASNAESTLTIKLDEEISRAKAKESSIDAELGNRYTKDKVFTKDEVLNKIKELIGTAPEVLDTFGEIAEALGNDPNFATTITTMLAGKVDKVTGKQLSTNDFDNTQKSNLTDCNNKKHTHDNKSVLDGITSALITAWNNAVSHISDTVKHITSAERTLWNTVNDKLSTEIIDTAINFDTLINNKLYYICVSGCTNTPVSDWGVLFNMNRGTKCQIYIPDNKTAIYKRHYGSGAWGAWTNMVSKTAIGLGNVDNTSDANKPISTATQKALDGKANSSHLHDVLNSKGKKTATDLPSTWWTGIYMTEVYNNGYPCSYGNCLTMKSTNNAITQICMEWKGTDKTIGLMWIRNKRDGGEDAWSAWREFSFAGHTHTKSQITDMPTKLSQFTNDKGFITQNDVDTSQNHTHSNKSILDKITQTLLDNWNSAYSHISDTIKHIVGKTINGSFATSFRTQVKGNSSSGAFIQPIRNDTASVANSPQYGTGIGFGMGDTHGYLYMNYNNPNVYAGAGNADKLIWTKELAFKDSNVASATKATQDSDGKQINTTYVKKGCTWNELEGM